jgi:hypothetical protein
LLTELLARRQGATGDDQVQTYIVRKQAHKTAAERAIAAQNEDSQTLDHGGMISEHLLG